jgi:hypothetical protein
MAINIKRKLMIGWITGAFLFPLTTYSLAQEQDFGAWYALSVRHRLNSWLDISISPELRYFNNHQQIDKWLIEGDVTARLNKHFRFGGFYRYAVEHTNPDYNMRANRLGVYGRAEYRIKPIDVSYRSLIYTQYNNRHSSANGHIPTNVWRNKVELQYSRKKQNIEPYLSGELIQTISPAEKNGRFKLRLATGIDIKINKQLTASLGYMRQSEHGVNNPITSHIVTSQLKIRL